MPAFAGMTLEDVVTAATIDHWPVCVIGCNMRIMETRQFRQGRSHS
jgi:hypothetical protein